MRTFVAIDLDNRIKTHIQQIIEKLDTRDGSIKWLSRQAMHITLKFLGEISESQQADVETILERIVGNHSSFILQCRGTGTFPHKSRNPRVLWIGLDKNEHFNALHFDIEEKMAGLGFPKDNRRFSPHLTLGRVKKKAQLHSILTGLQQYHSEHFGDIIVKKVIYYKSDLKPTGAEYTVLSEHKLK